jgi:hypothetical protein
MGSIMNKIMGVKRYETRVYCAGGKIIDIDNAIGDS